MSPSGKGVKDYPTPIRVLLGEEFVGKATSSVDTAGSMVSFPKIVSFGCRPNVDSMIVLGDGIFDRGERTRD